MASFTHVENFGSSPPGLRLPQAKLSRKSNQVTRHIWRSLKNRAVPTTEVECKMASFTHVENFGG